MDKEIHYEVTTALSKLDEIYEHINKAKELTSPGSFIHDTLEVAYRNLGMSAMKLQVAQDITETVG